MSEIVDVVRVFTDPAGGHGNELGLIRSSQATKDREQRIAARLGFSETVFVEHVDRGVASIRIFTPASELPFAGHPSVGCAWWLAAAGSPVEVLAERAGDVAVRTEGEVTWITGRADWAPEFAMHPTASVADVEALDPGAFASGQHFAWAWADETAGAVRARRFAPAMGIVEDEATGAAAVRLTASLERDLVITQGAGSIITTRYRGDTVEVGGRTVFDRTVPLPAG
jgi:predicted PhzF superfamily epimerase YddE/YHI9